MDTQQNIFSNPIVHNGDPVSSHIAAAKMNQSARKTNADIVRGMLLMYCRTHDTEPTSRELYDYYMDYFESRYINVYEVARRLSDLKAWGRVIQCRCRRCLVARKTLVTWKPISI